jgi:hypothetical protein
MEKIKKQNERVVNLDLSIKSKAKKEDWERYEALLVTFGNYLFQNKIGTWSGRETAMEKLKGKNEIERINYWYVLESGIDKAFIELKRIIKNFRLVSVTKMEVGSLIKSKTDYKTKFEKEKEFSWIYHR